MVSAFDLSGGYQNSIPTQQAQTSSGGRWINGQYVTPGPGMIWGPNGQLINAQQQQLGQLAVQQAQSELAPGGVIEQMTQAGAAAADPFAGQRGQYQNALQNLMAGQFSTSDPSYQFRLQQGQQALERSAAAKGMLGSGNILQALQDYGQGAASQEFQNQYNRLLPLTGATTGSPGQAGAIRSGAYQWRQNALANLGAGMQAGNVPLLGGGGSSNFTSSRTPEPAVGGWQAFRDPGKAGADAMNAAAGGGGGGFQPGGFLGGAGGGGAGGGYGSLGTTAAESNNALANQLAAGYTPNPYAGGGMINAVPTVPRTDAQGNPLDAQGNIDWAAKARRSFGGQFTSEGANRAT